MSIDAVGSFKAAMPTLQRNPAALIGGFVIIAILNVVVQGIHIPVVSPIISFVASAFLMAGYMSMALAVHDGRPAAIGDLFKPQPTLGNMLAVQFITSVAIIIGFIFLIIPGLIAAVLLGFAPLLVLEQNMAPMDALKRSVDISKPLLGTLIVFAIVASIVNFIGALLLGFGLLVTVPLTMLAWVAIYRQVASPARRHGTGPVGAGEYAEN
ncbi:MAG: hypothetical protein JWM80_4228 [Cyanobacteria bacterium RYN_339]|nr:hypothetical protein [Cyanobacteria bacterium RYN_339]